MTIIYYTCCHWLIIYFQHVIALVNTIRAQCNFIFLKKRRNFQNFEFVQTSYMTRSLWSDNNTKNIPPPSNAWMAPKLHNDCIKHQPWEGEKRLLGIFRKVCIQRIFLKTAPAKCKYCKASIASTLRNMRTHYANRENVPRSVVRLHYKSWPRFDI